MAHLMKDEDARYELKEPIGHETFEEPSEGAGRDGWVLITAGQLCMALAAIPVVWILDSYRDGSNFWLWWALALGGVGLVLGGIGKYLQDAPNPHDHPQLDRVILSASGKP